VLKSAIRLKIKKKQTFVNILFDVVVVVVVVVEVNAFCDSPHPIDLLSTGPTVSSILG